ncbi:hypothetical protein J2S82_003406 [Aeromonas caviae]|uniref:hypothetical protein n=1 Tax=Aeromonas caviae TaxID=648 RepID=UPI00209FFABD|nr:hypothetical protein [Aeromonas caviae]MCP1601449.1 hypothetical protein [Aeromonas caviae]
MNNQTEQIDLYVARGVALVATFVSLLVIMGPLFFLYHILEGGAPIYEWGRLSLSLFFFVTLFMVGVIRVKGGMPWPVCIAMPLIQVVGLVYLVSR